jgi:hypothetical protein
MKTSGISVVSMTNRDRWTGFARIAFTQQPEIYLTNSGSKTFDPEISRGNTTGTKTFPGNRRETRYPIAVLRIFNHQPSTINHQPSTINHQPSTINHQPSTINHQPSTINRDCQTAVKTFDQGLDAAYVLLMPLRFPANAALSVEAQSSRRSAGSNTGLP